MKFKIILFLGILLPAITWAQGSVESLVVVKRLIANKNFNDAIAKANEILGSGENKEAYILRASAYHQIKEYKREIADLKKALELEDTADARLSLAFAYQIVRDTAESNRMIALNLERYPDHIPTVVSAAAIAALKKQNDVALKILTDAYTKHDSPIALQARAGEYRRQGKYEKALADYETLIALRKSSSYYMSAAQCASQVGNYKKTLEYYKEYLTLNPNSSTALNNVGYELRKIGKFQDAEVYFKKAIDVSPKNVYPLVGQTLLAYMQGDVDKAFSIIDAALLFDTKIKIAALARGSISAQEGDLIAAESDYKQVLSDPQHVKYAYPALTKVYIYKGEYARAVDFVTDYIERQNIPSSEAYNTRGFAYYKMGKTEEAMKDFLYAMELEENYQPIFRYLNKESNQPVKSYTHIQFFLPFNDVNDSKSGFFTDGKKDFDFKIRIISEGEVDASKISLYEREKPVDQKYWSLKKVEKREFKWMDMFVTDVTFQYTPNIKKSSLKLSYNGSETQTITLIR
ncbi:Tetratricopeptide TPR_1 repeat-containing protein [Pseudopedobacter saltans DSM 12145]|uniref:Tetratricopeptide TPR_1 repeat-containing protein n=1 Tax=Pseudopedobacter saltans (strain ATCC 51119 / DSM 12145 / JCM 21818 / CCUG 39354 / LMG 10337 / NBRC 100064 / NCIMB 13643) TaxID=762903 RepID=F0S8E1_PSESL|nr:tetratricopeptide repeat protein [Pseudopedobacter saltans]ADY53405.1 Tetratricopeptide TPR_1 repeat-containing protein [Pseudopedobacter saltans DSM 12145]